MYYSVRENKIIIVNEWTGVMDNRKEKKIVLEYVWNLPWYAFLCSCSTVLHTACFLSTYTILMWRFISKQFFFMFFFLFVCACLFVSLCTFWIFVLRCLAWMDITSYVLCNLLFVVYTIVFRLLPVGLE